MQTSSIPTKIPTPFANSGTKNTIPIPSQIGITGGAASFTDGFPPLTRTAISAGGIPPFGADFNGIFNAITQAIRWTNSGSGYPFDSDFSTEVTGYPNGALIPASDYSGYWINTIDANTTAPENLTSAITGWVPGVFYGETILTGLGSSSVTLSTLQAAKQKIILSGTLTASINVTMPAWKKAWTVINNCSGAFSVTCKTPSGTGVSIPSGVTASIIGDGVNISTHNMIASSNLSEILRSGSVAQAAARTNLALGTTATTNIGNGSGQVPDMSFFAALLQPSGYTHLPNGLILQWTVGPTVTNGGSLLTVTYPIPFPNATRQVIVSTNTYAPSYNSDMQFQSVGASPSGCTIIGQQFKATATGTSTNAVIWAIGN